MMSDFIKAVKNGDLQKVKLLLSVPDLSMDNNAIRYAIDIDHLEIVKLLLSDPRFDPSLYNNHAIWHASEKGHTEIVKLLLADPRVNPSVNNNYAIRYASNYGHFEVVKLLLADPRVNPSVNNNQAIEWASRNGHFEVVKLLLTDPRVDWRDIDEKMKLRLLKDADVKLKDEVKASSLIINRMTPKMRIEQGSEQELKALIPKSVRKNIVYRAQYECTIKGEIPPIKLIALANLLKIQYDENISWKELCGKVKFSLLEML